jgi:hypothetical protein
LKLLAVLALLGVLACHKYQINDIRPIKVSGILAIQGLLVLLNDVSDIRVMRVTGRIGILVILVLLG